MGFEHDDREGQIIELTRRMDFSMFSLYAQCFLAQLPYCGGEERAGEAVEKFRADIEQYSPEVSRLNHPALTKVLADLEDICKTGELLKN